MKEISLFAFSIQSRKVHVNRSYLILSDATPWVSSMRFKEVAEVECGNSRWAGPWKRISMIFAQSPGLHAHLLEHLMAPRLETLLV